jgi:hypothetical protein
MIDLCDELNQATRFRLLMKLRELSPKDLFGEAFDDWALMTYGLHINSAGIIDSIEISEKDYTMLLLKFNL